MKGLSRAARPYLQRHGLLHVSGVYNRSAMVWQTGVDRLRHRYLVPRHATKADALISVSVVTTDHLQKHLQVPREWIHAIYSGLSDGFRTPIMEGMACGCPVLTANRFGTKESAGAVALLVDPESVDAIAAGIDRLLNDRRLRETNIAAGPERSRQFSPAHTAGELLRVLESL